MMQLRFGLIIGLSALSMVGCSTIGMNNGSLDYKKTTTLEPLKYPEGSMVRSPTPLYPAPVVEQMAIDHAPNLINKSGKRYEVPRPDLNNTSSAPANMQSQAIGPLQMVTDGNGNPLIKVDGNSDTIWKYTIATLNSLNHQVVGLSKNAFEATVRIDQQVYVLRLTAVGNSNNIALFKPDNSFADSTIASELLTQIHQNWPA